MPWKSLDVGWIAGPPTWTMIRSVCPSQPPGHSCWHHCADRTGECSGSGLCIGENEQLGLWRINLTEEEGYVVFCLGTCGSKCQSLIALLNDWQSITLSLQKTQSFGQLLWEYFFKAQTRQFDQHLLEDPHFFVSGYFTHPHKKWPKKAWGGRWRLFHFIRHRGSTYLVPGWLGVFWSKVFAKRKWNRRSKLCTKSKSQSFIGPMRTRNMMAGQKYKFWLPPAKLMPLLETPEMTVSWQTPWNSQIQLNHVESNKTGDGTGVRYTYRCCCSRMRSEGSRFIWGSGGEAVFAESCVCVRNRPPTTATVCVSAVRLSTVASAPGVIPKAYQVDSCRRSYIGVCRGGVCVSDLCRRSYNSVCRGGVCVSDLCRRSYIGVCSGGVCVSDLCRRSYIDICSGGVCVSDACRRSYIGVRRRGVCVSDLWRRSYVGVCRRSVCVSDLCRRSYIGVCSGGVCVSDLCGRSYIGVCRGGVCVK